MKGKRTIIALNKLRGNSGQILGLPANPRKWNADNVAKLRKSLERDGQFLDYRPLLVYPYTDEREGDLYCVVGGNMRLYTLDKMGREAATCMVLPEDTSVEELQRLTLLDNSEFGEYDFDLLDGWDDQLLQDCNIIIPDEVDLTPNDDKYSDKYAEGREEHSDALVKNFIVPPFSILDTKQGYWQERMRMWLEKTGNLSETRDGEFGTVSGNGGDGKLLADINGGTSNFDPVLAEIVMRWFCPKGGKIIDPFGGEQTKGVVAGELGMEYHAVEFRDDQVQLNRKACANYPSVHYSTGDSNNIGKIIKEDGFDLCFTSPPYYDLEVYSKEDMSALGTYEEFMQQYENIFSQCVNKLAEDAFLVVKICEIRDKKTGIYRNFVGDNISMFNRLGLHYYNEIILANAIGTAALRANNMMQSRKVVKIHQNVLVFYKGDIKNLCKRLPDLVFEDDASEQEQAEGASDGERASITAQDGGTFFSLMKPIYEQFSAQGVPYAVHGCKGLETFIAAATNGQGSIIYDKEPIRVQMPTADNRVLIAYTGGKDSTAEAIRLQARGYDVHLLFIKGLNKAYPKEIDGAQQIADILGCKMYTTEVKISGKNCHPDNPVKNQLILALMTDWGMAHGFSKFATGIINVPNPNYEYDWSDSMQLMEAFKAYMADSAQGWEYVNCGIKHEAENLVELMQHEKARELWQAKSSCVGAYRFRKSWREANEKKYGVTLTENQCGSCYKCAYEYVVRCAVTGNVTSAEYLRKCVGILRGEKAETYDITKYNSASEWAAGTFGEKVGAAVMTICAKYKAL